MMRSIKVWAVLTVLAMAGCGESGGGMGGGAATTPGQATASTGPAGSEADDAIPAGMRAVKLSPENTTIEFVCAHVAPKAPDPRKGGFEKYSGRAIVDPENKTLSSVSVDIETESLRAEVGGQLNPQLTAHLKSPDFFDVDQFKKASFKSTKIAAKDDGYEVTGKLTLHGVTKDITFPATISFADDKLSLSAKFKIDRTDFGINFDPKQVEKEVDLTVAITEK